MTDTTIARSIKYDFCNRRPASTVANSDARPISGGALRLIAHDGASPRRAEIEALIQQEFRRHFDADVREFMPTLVALHDEQDVIVAAVGCRSAATARLFLEVYTDKRIEELISESVSVNVDRDRIVEIGSLVCRDARAAMAIVEALVPHLLAAGFTWVAFTGADTIVRVLRRLKLLPLALCAADSDKLGAGRGAWGRYYEHNPVVMAGRLSDGLQILERAANARC